MLRPGIRRYLRLRPRTFESISRQVDEEIALHIELRVRDLVARGMSPEVARTEAERRFGADGMARLELQRLAMERERRMSVREWVSAWRQDLRYSARVLAREPLVALVIVVTLALGIGANATMFGIVDQLLLRGPAHARAPEQLRRVYLTQRQWEGGRATSATTGYVTYALLRDGARTLAGVAAYRRAVSRLGRGEAAREVPVGWSTWDMFPLLGVTPVLGRFYSEEEDRPPLGRPVAVIDHGFWQAEYGGARDVLGRTVLVADEAYTIIGVAPRGFTGPELKPVSIWLPMTTGYKPRSDWETTWNARWIQLIARVRPGVSAEAVAEETTGLYRAAATAAGRDRIAEANVSVLPLRYGTSGEEPAEVGVTRWLMGVSLIVLLVACANVANLLLARALRRRREIAIRLAMGVSRGRLVRLLLSESILLAVAGGIAALALAYWGGQFLRITLLPDVQWDAPLSRRVLLFSGATAVMTGVLIGLVPALQSGRGDLTAALKEATRQTGAPRNRARGALTAAQAAFSLVLLVGAGLFVRSLWNVHRLDLGIDADRVLAVWASFPDMTELPQDLRSAEIARRNAFHRTAIEHLIALPGIENAALALGTPLQGGFGVAVFVPGRDSIPELPGGGPFITAAGPGYFATVGTRIVRGRGFGPDEGAGTEPVVVVNETMARTLWPGDDALGKCLVIGEAYAPCARVIGVAQNAHHRGIREDPAMQYYIPLGQERGIAGTQILVRPRGNAAAYIPEVSRRLYALDATLTYLNVNPLQQTLDPQIRPWRLGATMFLIFGALALLIAAIGLYSVIAYGVAQRRVEIGVRMALGARTGSIVAMILRQGLALVLGGIGAGIVIALVAGRFLEPLLFETSGRDALTLVAVAGLLAAAAVAASALPARRAAHTDPSVALRAD